LSYGGLSCLYSNTSQDTLQALFFSLYPTYRLKNIAAIIERIKVIIK